MSIPKVHLEDVGVEDLPFKFKDTKDEPGIKLVT